MNNVEVNIPDKIEIIDTTVKVRICTVAGAIGFADYHNNEIIIDPSITDTKKVEVFYHELTHWILFKMGNKLEADENFVSMFASILSQSLKGVKEWKNALQKENNHVR